jgi:hypothetical protein
MILTLKLTLIKRKQKLSRIDHFILSISIYLYLSLHLFSFLLKLKLSILLLKLFNEPSYCIFVLFHTLQTVIILLI